MQFWDHQIGQRLARIQDAFTEMGEPVALAEHRLTVEFGNLAVGASSAPVSVLAPRDCRAWAWLGTVAYPHILEPGDVGHGLNALFKSGYLVRITQTSNGKTMGRNRRRLREPREWTPLMAIAGSAGRCFTLPTPVMLSGADQLVFEAHNGTNGAQSLSNAVRLVLIGAKLFSRAVA